MKSIIVNVLTAFYQPFWFAVILSILFMFVYKTYPGFKAAFGQWVKWFKTESSFRRIFLLVFYTAMILFRTLLNRDMWANPLSNVLGTWVIFTEDGTITTEPIENFILFLPFVILLFWGRNDPIFSGSITLKKILLVSARITFLFSFTIEMLQLLFRLGTWQVSDLFYNTAGGIVGGLIYYAVYRIKKRKEPSIL